LSRDITVITTIARGGAVIGLVLLGVAFVVPNPFLQRDVEPAVSLATATPPGAGDTPGTDVHPGFIYGRITTIDGNGYEGRLRWGGDQEAFWSDYFNGAKAENRWAAYAAEPEDSSPIEIFGLRIGGRDRGTNLRRLFMARFGDIARIEPHFRDAQVTLKSGTVVALDRFAAGDIDDGIRVWDRKHGVVDVDARQIRTIEFLAAAPIGAGPARLHGTVRTRHGTFTGFIQWDQQHSVGSDELRGRTTGGEVTLRYETIRSITRTSRDTALVMLLDGHEMTLSATRAVGSNNRGIYVDDVRYGRVLVSWDAFERVDFGPGGSGPGYADYLPGRALTGSVTTRDGRRLSGRLVYDFDESETTETLDAALPGVDYNIPFSLIASILPNGREGHGAPHATVILRGGEELQLERTGDLGDRNAGVLVFADSRERPDNVPWTDVAQIELVNLSGDHQRNAQ
jgi:hypothetical protein